MAHVLVLHAPADAATAGAVAAVLSDLTAFRVEVTSRRPLWRFGPNVVAVAIWTSNRPDDDVIEALARVLASAEGRAVMFCFGSAFPPESLTRLCRTVLHETAASADDTARLRASILEAAETSTGVFKSGPDSVTSNSLQTGVAKSADYPPARPRRAVAPLIFAALAVAVVGGVGFAFAVGGGADRVKALADDISRHIKPPPVSESFQKSVGASSKNSDIRAQDTSSTVLAIQPRVKAPQEPETRIEQSPSTAGAVEDEAARPYKDQHNNLSPS